MQTHVPPNTLVRSPGQGKEVSSASLPSWCHAPNTVSIYVDGSCSGNPGPGAVAVVVVYRDRLLEQYVHTHPGETTAYRMELLGILSALKACPSRPLLVYSDAETVVNGCTGKQGRGAHHDLWAQVDALLAYRQAHDLPVQILWRRGHNGDVYQELADRLAHAACQKLRQDLLSAMSKKRSLTPDDPALSSNTTTPTPFVTPVSAPTACETMDSAPHMAISTPSEPSESPVFSPSGYEAPTDSPLTREQSPLASANAPVFSPSRKEAPTLVVTRYGMDGLDSMSNL